VKPTEFFAALQATPGKNPVRFTLPARTLRIKMQALSPFDFYPNSSVSSADPIFKTGSFGPRFLQNSAHYFLLLIWSVASAHFI